MNIRNLNGRFVEGNSGGPGRPPRQTEAEYLKATMRGCSLADWEMIVKRAVTDAKGGNTKAREWLGKYLMGNPDIKAPSPFGVIVDDEVGTDRVAEEATVKKLFSLGNAPLRSVRNGNH